MNVDSLFRLLAALMNTALFAGILSSKAGAYREFWGSSSGQATVIAVIALCSIAYFTFFYLAVSDSGKRIKRAAAAKDDTEKNRLEIQDIMLSLSGCGIEEGIKDEIRARLGESIKLFGKEETLKNLVIQHRVCLENERFYEQIAWQIGSFFVPVSFTLSALGQTQQLLHRKVAVVGGCLLLWTWVFLFGRFRTNIRLYRDCARLIEEMIGFFAATYVYDLCFERYGRVVRVWPFLVTLCGLYFNYMIFVIL